MAIVRRRVVVYGLVQGVFYRDTCRRVAEQNGVAGWVGNRLDGAVEAVFEGDAASVQRTIEWARLGPRRAIVEQMEVLIEDPEGLTGFKIRT